MTTPQVSSTPLRSSEQRRAVSGRKGKARRALPVLVAWAVLILLGLFGFLPLVVMLTTSFKPADQIFRIPPEFFPTNPTLDHYIGVLTDSAMPRAIVTSAAVAALVAVVTLLIGSGTGYAIARLRFRGSSGLSVALLLGQLLPITVLMLPVFQVVARLGLIDTIPGVALAHLTVVVPLVTWMLTTAFAGAPIELEEAAMVDGCGRPRAVWNVVLPVVAPSLVAVGIFAFLQSWNEFIFASVISRSAASKTAPVALTDFAGQFSTDWGATMAAATIVSLPMVVAFMVVQRYFVQGLASGAVKG